MKGIYSILLACIAGIFAACGGSRPAENDFVAENVRFAGDQLGRAVAAIEKSGKCRMPVTLATDSTVYYCGYADWRSGFFPGSLWYLYELTGDSAWLATARNYTASVGEARNLTWHHDVGFIIGCSFGNEWRMTGNPDCRETIVQTARSLSTRFREAPGVIQSWDVTRGWQAERGWECPVIIDNMMNLEVLFRATEFTGDSSFYQVAVSHADRTLQEHFRPDGSCYHVVDYSVADGSVRHRQTAQGYADESVWSRGQAWAVYGFTVCYRETGDRKYLDRALATFRFMRDHPAMPADCIPYWDMDAPGIPDEPRDASSAACIASALYEISSMGVDSAADYKAYADRILASLASPAYRAAAGTNGNFLLMHSVGSIPHGSEIDVPLNYADYYFLEALSRKEKLEKNGK